MLAISLFGVFLMVASLSTVTPLECYECLEEAKCQEKVVQCNDGNSQAMTVLSSILFYPKLNESVLLNGKYQCTALQFSLQGVENRSLLIKGCMFETKESLCRLEADIPNGNFSCRACNTNKCNAGSALGWSFVLVMASLMALSWVQ